VRLKPAPILRMRGGFSNHVTLLLMKNLGLTRVLLAAGLGLALCAMPGSAGAQTEEERAGARAAATEGAKAFRDEQWQDAVDLFQRAESLVHAPPHLLYMARAHEKLGNLVKARELYNKITREKLAPGSPDAFRQAQVDAAEGLKGIEPRLARLTVKVEGPADVSYQVAMDGEEVPSALVGIARPVDPGDHEITVSAKGYKAEPATVTLGEGGSDTVTLRLVEDPSAAAATPAGGAEEQVRTPATASTPTTPAEPTHDAKGGANGMRVGSFVALGVGVVGIGVGTAFGLKSRTNRSDADALEEEFLADCGDACSRSDPRAREIDDLDDEAKSAQTLSAVGFAVGGVGLATGAVLFLVSGKKRQSAAEAAPRVRGWVGIGSAGVSGQF
jgi:hypothetical protein